MRETEVDDELEYVDFSKLFTAEEIKLLTKKNRKKFYENSILGINRKNFFIYLITFIISFVMVGVYLLILDAEKSRLLGVIMSIGASAIGAAILAAFVERSNYIINKKERIMRYNNSVVNIYNQLWLIFANRSYKYLNKIESGADVFAQQAANRFVTQYKTSIIAIDNMLLDFYDMMGDCNIEFYQTLQQQLVHFISSLENPTSTENLIILLDGTKGWLRGNFDKEKLKKSLFIYYPEINSDTHKK